MAATVAERARILGLNGLPLAFALGSYRASIQNWGFIAPRPWRNWLHSHTFFEICYAYAGHGEFLIMGQRFPIARGQVFIARPGEEHEILALGSDPLGIYFWTYTLVPAEAAADPVVDPLVRDFQECRSWVSRRVPGMQRTLDLLAEEAGRREPGYPAAVEGLARKLLLDTARAALGPPRPGERPGPQAAAGAATEVERARAYIHDNLGRALSLPGIAAQTGLSERHLARLFRRAHGQTPMAYLAERRMELAGQLLIKGLPIKEIAPQVGFHDVRYFTTAFRRALGMPPARYRAQHGTRWADARRTNANRTR